MKKFNKKGFTLVELLVTIVLLGIVATIIIYNMTNVSKGTKESDYEKFVASIKSASAVYADTNPDVFNDLYVNKAFLYITIKDLVTNGLLPDDTINPYTEERVGFDELIKANLDSTSGLITFQYPLTEKEEETFLVALADYIVWDEQYTTSDCMYGAGTYQLALSTENGDLIDLSDPAQVEKYHVTCTLPDDFNSKKEGVYKITYNWITESGTKKSAHRDLRVMPKVIPTFITNDPEYKFGEWYTPKYDATTKKWETLKFTPYIEGADENTTYEITKTQLSPKKGTPVSVTNGKVKDLREYDVDDGSKEYLITTSICGHHHPDVCYPTEGTAVMKSRLILPPSYISGGSNKWNASRSYSIREPKENSPVGINKYEFRLITYSDKMDNNSVVNNSNTFPKKSQYTEHLVSVGSVACSNSPLKFDAIAFRAINNEGYAGDWTVVDAYITNQLDLVVGTSCSSCSTTGSCVSESGGNCYYTAKNLYVRYGRELFVILEKMSDGNLLVALDGTFGRVSPISMKKGEQTVQTCNGTYTARYEYASASLSMIRDTAQQFLGNLPSNYSNYVSYYNWPYGSAFVGNIDLSMFNKYGRALYSSSAYWTTSTKSESFESKVPWGAATAWNTYIYYIASGSSQLGYAGMSAAVKPILKMRTVYICGGSGTSSDPYIVAS